MASSIISIFFSLLLLLGCTTNSAPSKERVTAFQGVAMTIPYSVQIGVSISDEQEQKVVHLIQKTFNEINDTYNKWNPNSEISKVNRLQAGVLCPLSPELYAFLKRCEQFVVVSSGQFDPTVESLQQLWVKAMEQNTVPSQEEIASLQPALGWYTIELTELGIKKNDARTSFDLGGIAKGLLVDLITERLVQLGYPDLLVEWGGEFRAHGQHPDQRPWRVSIVNPYDCNPSKALDCVNLHDQAFATSGDYFQYWRVTTDQGVENYSHVVDIQKKAPRRITSQSLVSVSVLAPHCVTADALATTLLLQPDLEAAKSKSLELKKAYPEAEFWLAGPDSSL